MCMDFFFFFLILKYTTAKYFKNIFFYNELKAKTSFYVY